MEEKKFFQLFLYSLVNLVSFLLSVIFLTSLYNVRSQTKLIGIDKRLERDYHEDEKYRSYGNSYVGIAVLFTFCFFGFFGFMVILMMLVKQYKIDNLDRERMRKIHANPTKSENKVDSKDNNNGNNGTYENQNITTTISPSVAYTRERANTNGKTCTSGTYCNDTVIRTSTWTGKIALMYLSDYGFATSGGDITNRQTCLESNLDSWSNSNISDCKNNNWLEKKQFTWTLSPSTIEPFARNAMILPIKTYPTFYDFEVYPSLYLKSSVVVTGGAGTQDNPYIIA